MANRSFSLDAAHAAAVDRRRRFIVHYDAAEMPLLGWNLEEWLAFRFDFADEAGSQIDSLWWDIGMGDWAVYPSEVLAPFENPGLLKWQSQGIDWVRVLVEETHRRGLEAFWNHRISEVDIRPAGGLEMEKRHPLKAARPEWTIRSWWWQGLWDFSVPAVRDYKVRILREIAEQYDFDGIQIDFARHMPCLPPGRQWGLRAHVTEFMAMVRAMLQEVAARRGRPYLLAARVPETVRGCREDGLDVAAWSAGNLVDLFTLGTRSIDVDLAGFREITAGRHIRLHPCLDDHHATDGYRYPPIEFFRGVFANWWRQGADGITTFNWSNAAPEQCARMGVPAGPASQRQAYHEGGDPEAIRFRDKVFAVQRRGGYPWSEGTFNHNRDAPLPARLPNHGGRVAFRLDVSDSLSDVSEQSDASIHPEAALRVILFGVLPDDAVEVRLNGRLLRAPQADPACKDAQIFSPRPQPASGGSGEYRIDPEQRLLSLTFRLEPAWIRQGRNRVSARVVQRGSYPIGAQIQVEKIELAVRYHPA